MGTRAILLGRGQKDGEAEDKAAEIKGQRLHQTGRSLHSSAALTGLRPAA